jgi:hypothetical protein
MSNRFLSYLNSGVGAVAPSPENGPSKSTTLTQEHLDNARQCYGSVSIGARGTLGPRAHDSGIAAKPAAKSELKSVEVEAVEIRERLKLLAEIVVVSGRIDPLCRATLKAFICKSYTATDETLLKWEARFRKHLRLE